MVVAAWALGTAAFLGVVLWVSHRMLVTGAGGSTGMADALGSFIDVFDPARKNADLAMKSLKNQGAVTPSPDDDDDRPVRVVNDASGSPVAARIRRPPRL
jgi:hypothetical protein